MLVKLAGSALVIGATSTVGWQVANLYARRPVHLRDLQVGLAVLQTEIDYGATPLPQALAAAADAAGGPVGEILRAAATELHVGEGTTAAEALRRATAEKGGATALVRPDLEVLGALAAVLGCSDRLDQVRHLRLAQERLCGEEQRAQEARSRYERMARYIGVLTGTALVLILL